MSNFAVTLLQKQFQDLTLNPPEGISVGLKNDVSLFEWNVVMEGPAETPYEDGLFKAELIFPVDFPNKPPTMRFISRMWHPNIFPNGCVCISILHPPGIDDMDMPEPENEKWRPIISVEAILLSVQNMLSDPNDKSPANLEAAVPIILAFLIIRGNGRQIRKHFARELDKQLNYHSKIVVFVSFILFMFSGLRTPTVSIRKGLMAHLHVLMEEAWRRGIDSDDIVYMNTSSNIISEKGCDFIVLLLNDIRYDKKKSNIKTSDKKIIDPFSAENRDPMLVVKEFSKHTLMLNKFPVLKNHCVLVTNGFKSQCDPLDLEDFKCISDILCEVPSLVFFNCGLDSGASQPHKHIQFIPYSQYADHKSPFDVIMEKQKIDSSVATCSVYDFPHSLFHVSEEDKKSPETLLESYQTLLKNVDKTSYNFLLTREWMMVVPRCRESWEGFNINSLGFIGSFFVRNEEMLHKLKEYGPLKILRNVVCDDVIYLVCFMSFVGKIKGKVQKGVVKLRQSSLFQRKTKKTEEDDSLRISDVDIAIAKIKSQKRKINDLIRKTKGESSTYLEKSIEERKSGNNDIAAKYFKIYKDKQDYIVSLTNMLISLDQQIDTINNAQELKDFTDVLQSSGACIESLQKSTGDINSVMSMLNQLDDIIKDRDEALFGDVDLSDSLSITEEMLNEIPNVEVTDKASLPSVPNHTPSQDTSLKSPEVSSEQSKAPVLVESDN